MIRMPTLVAMLALLPAAVPAVTVTLDQEVYQVGDLIQITFINPDDATAVFPSEPPFGIVRLDGEYPGFASLPVLVFLGPGETMLYTWDTGSLPDPPGLYQIVVTWWLETNPSEVFTIEVPYVLEGVIARETTTWSAVRQMYR